MLRRAGDVAHDRAVIEVIEVLPGTAAFEGALTLASEVLAQDRYLIKRHPTAQESHVLGAFSGRRCAGFLRYLVQVIGADLGRPPPMRGTAPLTEGFVEAFGVAPDLRRQGIGTALQTHAIGHCRVLGCHQMRSRSPTTSVENYALKVDAGYVMSPSEENDSYYFLLRL